MDHTTLELKQMDKTTVVARDGYIVIEQEDDNRNWSAVFLALDRLGAVIAAMQAAAKVIGSDLLK